jgi:hypothetical protein
VALPGGLAEPFETPLLYPLTTVLAAVPVASLPLRVAGAITMAVSGGAFAYVITRDGLYRLWMLASAPFVMAINLGQWSPLVTVAAFVAPLGMLVTLKPNVGLAVFSYRPTRWMVLGSVAVIALSLVVLPRWPLEWLRAVQSLPGHPAPVLSVHGAGLVLLLAALRWRRPEARLLLVSACVPQLMFFADQLPLMLVARTRQELVALTACTLVAFVGWFVTLRDGEYYVPAAAPFVLFLVYVPALVMVLRRPNTSEQAVPNDSSTRGR